MAIILQQDCENLADYTDTSIPVTVEYDEANSIPIPGPGELQRFCYIVTQVEEPTALSHWLLGICPELTIDDFGEITVTINGEPQTVITDPDDPNVNVEIFTEDNPDPSSGCPGLKFNFGLEEAEDVMTVCFELLETHQIGPNNVCLFGGGETETGLSVCGPICGIIETCDTTVFQTIGVCVPVTITPFALVGPINVTCCGDADISTEPCPETLEPSCTFYVRRNICAEVPVRIGATGEPGTAAVTCGTPSEEPCDCNGNG